MSVIHSLTGYDKRTETIAYRHLVPADKLPAAKELARVSAVDPGAVGVYPLTPSSARRLALQIGLLSLDGDLYDWFLECTADIETVKRRIAG